MKIKLYLIGTIIAGVLLNCSVKADYQENFWWNKSWFAKSTSGIEHIITDGYKVTFNFLTDRCVEDVHRDCYYNKLRSQLQSKGGKRIGEPTEHRFSIMKEKSHGTPMKIWELKPFGGDTNTVPTITINNNWINIKTSNDGSDNNIFTQEYYLPPGVWNNFHVKTIQSTNDDGYVIVTMNGETVFEWHGKTSYAHRYINQFWIGPYICCGNAGPNEPNHVVHYRNVH